MPNQQQNMVNITGLWLGIDKNEQQYMAGNCGGVRYWVFKNKNKKKDSDPDYLLKVSQNLKPKKDKPIEYGEDIENEDIPF